MVAAEECGGASLPGYACVERVLRLLRPVPVYILLAGDPGDERLGGMTVSWVAPYSKRPPGVLVVLDKGSFTLRIIREKKIFTLNLVSEELAPLAKYLGTHTGWEEDKLEVTRARLGWVYENRGPPYLVESPGFLLLRVLEEWDLGPSIALKTRVVAGLVKREFYSGGRGFLVEEAKPVLHVWKHFFTVPCREAWSIVDTPWGRAVKKPWRDRISRE